MELNMQATDGGANPNYKPLNAPKLTPADIEAVIVNERYFTAAEGLANRVKSDTALLGGIIASQNIKVE